jgi:hypothetical protein
MLLEFFTDIDSSKPKFSFKNGTIIEFLLPLVYERLYYQLVAYTNINSENNFIAYSKFRIYDYYHYYQSLIKTSSHFRITNEKGKNYITNNSIEY